MANGEAVSTSRAPYIIICQGRIEVALSRSGFEMIRAASRTAVDLVTYYGNRLTDADTKPISELQHAMMDLVEGKANTMAGKQPISAAEMVDEMFALLDALEQHMKS